MDLNYRVIYAIDELPERPSDCVAGFLFSLKDEPVMISDRGERLNISGFRHINLIRNKGMGTMLKVEMPGYEIYLAATMINLKGGFAIVSNRKTKNMKDDLEMC